VADTASVDLVSGSCRAAAGVARRGGHCPRRRVRWEPASAAAGHRVALRDSQAQQEEVLAAPDSLALQ